MGKLHYNSNIERVRYKQKGKKWKRRENGR